MNITHIIGNGFDINQGIPSTYAHFYEYYLQLVPDESELISQFRTRLYDDLLKYRTDLWSDMELALGIVTNNYATAADYEAVYMDVYKHLMEYIDYAYRYSDVAKFDNPAKTLYQDIAKPWLHLVPVDMNEIEKSFHNVGDCHVNILSFNYTDTINRISDLGKMSEGGAFIIEYVRTYRYDGCIHIHHALSTKDIILGVDNVNQIANRKIADEEFIRNILVKPQTNRRLGTLEDHQSKAVIGQSDIISLYGVSLGATDQTWWKEIGKRIKNDMNVKVLYFPFEKNIDNIVEIQKPTLRTKRKHELMDVLGIDKSNYKNYENRIFVNFCNTSGKRNIFTNPKRESLRDNFENVMAVFQKEGKVRMPNLHNKQKLGVDSRLLQPPIDVLFTPHHYKAKNLHTDISNQPSGLNIV